MKQLFVLIHILFLLQEVTQAQSATAVTDRVKHQSGPQKVRESGRGDTLDSWNTQDDWHSDVTVVAGRSNACALG